MNNNLLTQYSIVSRGTEKYNNHGYIAVSKIVNGYRYLQNIDHNVLKSTINKDSIKIKGHYFIENIAVSRFQLIFELLYLRTGQFYQGNILIIGLGNIGFATLLSLLDKGYRDISILLNNNRKYLTKAIEVINKNYNIKINIVDYDKVDVNKYKTFVECSGSSDAIRFICDNCKPLSNVLIVSTPREQDYLINPLIINRKNMNLFGGHEFNGIDKKQRVNLLNQILRKNNKKIFLKEIVNIYPYSDDKLIEIKTKKRNVIEILKY